MPFITYFIRSLTCIISIFNLYSAEQAAFLMPNQRPVEIVNAIDAIYSSIASDRHSNWYYNGTTGYDLVNIADEKLVEKIITSQPKKKNFYFLDVGAGDFIWGRYIAEEIKRFNVQKHIAPDVHVHIINVRGEQNHPNRYEHGDGYLTWIKDDMCTVYNIGCFKIEEVENELLKYDITQPFDLIVSRWTLRHLVDPTGTLVQIYNRLNPNGGLFLGDGFFLDYNATPCDKDSNSNKNIALLLANSKAPYLIHPYDCGRSFNQFMVHRVTNTPLELPLVYQSIRSIGSNYQCASCKVVAFQETKQWQKELPETIYRYTFYDTFMQENKKRRYYGTPLSQSLFDWLLNNNLIASAE